MGLRNIFKKSSTKDSSSSSATKPSQKSKKSTSKPKIASTSPSKSTDYKSPNQVPEPKFSNEKNISTNRQFSEVSHSDSLTSRQTRRSTISEQKNISSIPTSFLRHSNTLSSLQYKRGPSRSNSSNSISALHPVENTAQLPDELIPIVTLIHAQQARSYAEMFVQVPIAENDWLVVSAKLNGTELAIWEMDDITAQERRNDDNGGFKPIYINISDSEFSYEKSTNILEIQLTNTKTYKIKFATKEDIDYFYSNLLLAQFEYKQLQESFTGALLSSKAIYFSDIRTLLAPNNKHIKEEWCVVRFPFLNDKWIRCFVVVSPATSKKNHGKVEMFTNSNKSKKSLLASLVNIRSCSSIYPESPGFIDSNSLLRLTGENYINEDLLLKIISGEINLDSAGGSRSRSSSIGLRKKKSQTSLLNAPNLNKNSPNHSRNPSFNKSHSRQESQISNLSGNKKLNNTTLAKTHLCYIIPETHNAVPPVETMIRLMIPIMNAFNLYGRPDRFISSREDRNSLLFGLPQLPHTQYLDNEISYQLVTLNIENSLTESWNNSDWFQVFKEMCFFKIEKGWVGSGNLIDTFKEGLTYNKARFDEMNNYEYDDYNPEEDFVDFNVDIPLAGNSSINGTRNFLNGNNSNTIVHGNGTKSVTSSPALKNLASLGLNTDPRSSTPPIDEDIATPSKGFITPNDSPQLEQFPDINNYNSPLAPSYNGNKSADSVYSSHKHQHQPPAIIIGTPNTAGTNDSTDSFYHDTVTGASPLVGGPYTQQPQPKYLSKSNNTSKNSTNGGAEGVNNFSFESVYSSKDSSAPASIAQAKLVQINKGHLNGTVSQLKQEQYFSSNDSVNNYVNPHNNQSSNDSLLMKEDGSQIGPETPDSDYDELSSSIRNNNPFSDSEQFNAHPISPIRETVNGIAPLHNVVGYGNSKDEIPVESTRNGQGSRDISGESEIGNGNAIPSHPVAVGKDSKAAKGGALRHQYRSLIDKVEV